MPGYTTTLKGHFAMMETIIGHLQTLTVLFFCARLALSSPPTTKRDPICQNVTFPITISSNNARLPAELDLSGTGFESFLTDLVGWVFDAVVEGTFNIAASYCEPEVRIPSRENTLQLLVHGATYDRNYWSGVGAPGHGYGGDEYSWVAYASQQGYPTLAIDRLGNGNSDHPDPLQVVQMPAHAEIAHGIVQLARAGSSPLPRAFDKIIYVGHSFGSLIGNLVNEKYPKDVDATILTGWSDNFVIAGIPIALGLVTLPSPVVDPIRFGDLSAGYLEVTSESGDVAAFFHEGDYDTALQTLQFTRRGTISVGELLTFPFATTEATGYKAPILVATAEEDAIFCNPTAGLLPANCGTGDSNMLAMSQSLYPVASVYRWYVVPNAGHCWQLHYTAQEGFNASHEWLAERGL